MAKIRSVSSLYLRLTLGLSTLIVILVGATMIVIDTRQHNLIVDQVSQSVSKQLKDAMSHQVSSAVTLINKVHEEETYRLKTQLAQQVRQAHQQASKILENNSDLPLSRKNELIIDTLRPIQFNGGRGSIFIADSKGELKLSPQIEYHQPPSSDSDIISPEEHSQLLSNTIHQVKMQDELFVEGLSPDFTDSNVLADLLSDDTNEADNEKPELAHGIRFFGKIRGLILT